MGTAAASSSNKPGYDVPRPAGRCAVSDRQIAPGEKFIAALRETPTGIERLDVSMECWEGFDRANLLGHWQTVMPRPEEKKKLLVDDEVLCSLFERLSDAVEPVRVSFRFMLGLILMRKRLIVYEGARRDADRDVWIVRMKGSQTPLDLIDPKLGEAEMAEVSRQMSQILNEEL